jgi:ubiquinone/menaquinone biosynthesis C-methylase UbiE
MQAQRAFDAAAPVYDELYEGLRGIRRMRAITSRLYLEYFLPAQRILEINCGTGNDALFLADHGRHVVATDLSSRMIDEVKKKALRVRGGGTITPRQSSFTEIHEIPESAFDGAFSNLGGLNCTDQLPVVAAGLASILKPGAFFIATVMSPVCLWETLASICRLRWGRAFRRMRKGGTVANVHGGSVRTFYYWPGTFQGLFAPYFEPVKTLGLAIVTPPPNSTSAYALAGKAIQLMEYIDDAVAPVPLLNSLGDHYVAVLRRK